MERPPVRDVVTLPAGGLPLEGGAANGGGPAGSVEQGVVVATRGTTDLRHVAVHLAELVDANLPVASRGLLSQTDAEQQMPRAEAANAPGSPSRTPRREGDRMVSEPLTAELCRLHVTIPTKTLEKIDAAPVALGGNSTVDDLRVACRAHNLDAARRVFGDAFIDARIRRRRAGGDGGVREDRMRVSPDAAARLRDACSGC